MAKRLTSAIDALFRLRWSARAAYNAVALSEGDAIHGKFLLACVCMAAALPFAALEVLGVPRAICFPLSLLSGSFVVTIWIASRAVSFFPINLFPERGKAFLDVLLSLEEAITLLEGGLRQIFRHLEETGRLPEVEGPIGERFSRASRIAEEINANKGMQLDWRTIVALVSSGSLTRWSRAHSEINRMSQLLQRAVPLLTAIEAKRGRGAVEHADRGRSVLADTLPILMDVEAMKVTIADLVAKERSAQGFREDRRVGV